MTVMGRKATPISFSRWDRVKDVVINERVVNTQLVANMSILSDRKCRVRMADVDRQRGRVDHRCGRLVPSIVSELVYAEPPMGYWVDIVRSQVGGVKKNDWYGLIFCGLIDDEKERRERVWII